MLRTVLLLGGRAVARKRTTVANPRMLREARQLERLQRKKREDKAERVFMEKIQQGRLRRQRIIAAALRRAFTNKQKGEPRFLQRYKANKARAAEELTRMKEKAEAPKPKPEAAAAAVTTTDRVRKAGDAERVKKVRVSREEAMRRREAERKAEQSFFEMIEELKQKREIERLAVRDPHQHSEAHVTVGQKKSQDEATEPAQLVAEDKTVADSSAQARKRLGRRVTKQLPVEEHRITSAEETNKLEEATGAPVEDIAAAVDTVAEEQVQQVMHKEDTTSRQPQVERAKPRVRSPRKHQTLRPMPTVAPQVNAAPVDDVPPAVGEPQAVVTQRPVHAVSLTGFNEPPLISPARTMPEVGQGSLLAFPSIDAPVIPLRPRVLDSFPPVARVAHAPPVSFPHNIPSVRPIGERQSPKSSGLHRL
ncbi:hypothetical protein DQ04_03581040 [Trypanosoma grayi]|uniref:hypothetical protein n=1 Tax=Trypanosoma grayi TaxID=71804 RepID=UPI0004F44E2C|nr:hypothetical protein DQ04_03581040 [Trypanosoma grayi]KEG10554.1 hypothetical protein DQ04_03581040 [Trypanosoma grayi]